MERKKLWAEEKLKSPGIPFFPFWTRSFPEAKISGLRRKNGSPES
jgi:hypothetical protein